MIGYKGKTPLLRQFMPNKHHARFGIKVWCLCDAVSGYTCTFEIYKGATDPQDVGEEGLTYNLVMRMMHQAGVLYRGYRLGLDNYFSSPKLFQDLYNMRTAATGTVRGSRNGLPKQCIKAETK